MVKAGLLREQGSVEQTKGSGFLRKTPKLQGLSPPKMVEASLVRLRQGEHLQKKGGMKRQRKVFFKLGTIIFVWRCYCDD
jgi:hypothetical protein